MSDAVAEALRHAREAEAQVALAEKCVSGSGTTHALNAAQVYATLALAFAVMARPLVIDSYAARAGGE